MATDWEWDDTLFSGTAAYYRRGRLPYAPGLADALADVLKLDGRGRLIDVGCGPGILALSLAHLFSEIVGVDPDGEMIAEARRGAAERAVTGKAQWVQARAEELPADLGTFTVATFGQSFHWMDRDLVAAGRRRSASNTSRRGPNRCGAENDIENTPATASSAVHSRTYAKR